MAMSDELEKLDQLHQRGALSDDEYARAKARVINGAQAPRGGSAIDRANALRRSRSDRWLGGVCGGLAEATGLASWIWRLIFAVLAMFGGAGVVVYLLLWILVPEAEAEAPGSARSA